MSGILNEPVQLLPCPICSQPAPANVVLRHKEAASQGNGRREETVDCDADMYALWCDTCREHPSKCPRRAALSRVPTADNAIYEPIIGNGVKALDRRESVILPRTDTRTDGVPTGGEAETIDDALFREWPEGCARPVDAGALHAETATRSAVQSGDAEDLGQLLRRVREGSIDAEVDIIEMFNLRRKELAAAREDHKFCTEAWHRVQANFLAKCAEIEGLRGAAQDVTDCGKPDYEAAAVALGFQKMPSGKWWAPNPLWHPSYLGRWDSAEAIFASWDRASTMSSVPAQAAPDLLAEAIAAKMKEPAFVEFAKAWTLREARWLPIIKMSPCAVSSWYVALPSGKEIILSKEDWEASAIPSASRGTEA